MEELPPGFRFYPTEEELISFYLHHKLQGTRPDLDRVIPIVDIYSHEPSDLPIMAGERGRGEHEEQWFFFTAQQEREARGGKPNRTTMTGYWKATGSPSYVFSTMHTKGIGVKKTMVFYKGRAPVGKKTHWKMNEYKAIDFGHDHTLDASSSNAPTATKLRHEMSVCRVYITSGSSRAFDRRPSGSITSLREPHHEQPLRLQSDYRLHHQLANTTTTTTLSTGDANINAPVLVAKSSSSTNSSRSGGDQKDHLLESNTNNNDNDDDDDDEMITNGLQPLWEWEQLNWP